MDITGAIFMEAFVSIHMSVFVLRPLSKIISKDNSKKVFGYYLQLELQY